MAGADRSTHDKAMAARLKREGIDRNTMRCPMCHSVVHVKRTENGDLGGLTGHMVQCTNRGSKE